MFLIDAKIAFFVCFLKAFLVVGGKGCGKPCTVMAVQTRIGKPRKIREGFDLTIMKTSIDVFESRRAS